MQALEFALVLIICSMVIASTSIGIQYYNMCPSLKKDAMARQNKNFLLASLMTACVTTVGLLLMKDNRKIITKALKKIV